MKISKNLNPLQDIYDLLYHKFGPQYWWPSDSQDETIMGAVLTQNVAWSNVEKALTQLKKSNIYTLNDILLVKETDLSDLIMPARYSRQKSVYLKEVAAFFKAYKYDYQYIVNILDRDQLRKKLLEVKGIGDETADTILLYALNVSSFVIDAYTKRILKRFGIIQDEKIKYKTVQELFHKSLKLDVKLFNEYHALIVKLAKEFCLKRNPDCLNCPLNLKCFKKIH